MRLASKRKRHTSRYDDPLASRGFLLESENMSVGDVTDVNPRIRVGKKVFGLRPPLNDSLVP